MELTGLQIHFNKLVDQGTTPSIIKRKMALSLEQWQKFSADYAAYQEFKIQEAERIKEMNAITVEQLAEMWERIELICFELRIEKDYEKVYALEAELETLSVKYSESQFKKLD